MRCEDWKLRNMLIDAFEQGRILTEGEHYDADAGKAKRGTWMTVEHGIRCSACKRTFNYCLWGAKYCPMCGAKMDGGKEDG